MTVAGQECFSVQGPFGTVTRIGCDDGHAWVIFHSYGSDLWPCFRYSFRIVDGIVGPGPE